MYIYISLSLYIYIYIYIERERKERERERDIIFPTAGYPEGAAGGVVARAALADPGQRRRATNIRQNRDCFTLFQ